MSNRNPVKNERRRSFRAFLEKNFGEVELEKKFEEIRIPDLKSRITMDRKLFSILEKIESVRGIKVEGQAGRKLAFDFYLPQRKTAIEFDERQHFTLPRAAAISAYRNKNKLGFDWERWIHLCEEINAGDNSPAYRDEQRAFYDAVRDVIAPRISLNHVIRIYEDDVHWEKDGGSSEYTIKIIHDIEILVQQ
jgi:very-short-patch-repair endonuclease